MSQGNLTSYAKIPQKQSIVVYLCGRKKCDPGETLGPVLRTQYVFCYVTSGKGIFRYRGIGHRVSAGHGFLISPEQIFSLESDSATPLEYLWIGFDGIDAIHVAEDMGVSDKRPLYKGMVDKRLEIAMNKLIDAYHEEDNNRYDILALFYACISLLQDADAVRHHGDKSYIEKALDYIHHNYTYRIRIEDMARFVGLDRTYMFKLFMKAMGIAPQEYLIRYRLEHAIILLQETKMTTAEIAVSCGFRDAPSFCKHFKARYNDTPTSYRKPKAAEEK